MGRRLELAAKSSMSALLVENGGGAGTYAFTQSLFRQPMTFGGRVSILSPLGGRSRLLNGIDGKMKGKPKRSLRGSLEV